MEGGAMGVYLQWIWGKDCPVRFCELRWRLPHVGETFCGRNWLDDIFTSSRTVAKQCSLLQETFECDSYLHFTDDPLLHTRR